MASARGAATRRRGCRRTARPSTSSGRDHVGEQLARWSRGRTRRRGRPGGSTRRRRAARPAPRRAGRRSAVSVPAAPCTRRTAWPSATSTAGSRVKVTGSPVADRSDDQRRPAATTHDAGSASTSSAISTSRSAGSSTRTPDRARSQVGSDHDADPLAAAAADRSRPAPRRRRGVELAHAAAGRRSRRRRPPRASGLLASATARSRRPRSRARSLAHGRHRRAAALTACASQLRSSAAPASPDFSGWNWVAAQRPVLDRGDERLAVLGRGDRRRSTASAVGRRSRGVRVHEVEPGRRRAARRTAPSRPAASTVFQPMCGSDRRAQPARPCPGSSPRPLVTTPCSSPRVEEHLHADADAEHRAARRRPGRRSPGRRRARRCPAMQAANAPTPGTTSPSAAGAAARSAVTVTSAPTRASARCGRAQVARPVVEHDDRGTPSASPDARARTRHVTGRPAPARTETPSAHAGGRSQDALGAGTPAPRVERRVAQRPGDRLELRLDDVVRVAARRQHPSTCRRDLRRRGRTTPRCAGSAWWRRPGRSYGGEPSGSSCTRYGRPDRSTAACTSASSSGTSASPKRRMPGLVAQRLARTPAPSASAVSSTVWCASISQVALGRARSGRSRRACRAGRACGRRTPTPVLDVGRAGAVEVELDEDRGLLGVALARGRCGSCRAPASDQRGRAPEERVDLLGRAGGDPQPAGQADVADQHAAVEQACQTACRVARTGRTARSSRRCRRPRSARARAAPRRSGRARP